MQMTFPFESWNSFWMFSRTVRHTSRFLHDDQVASFLQAVAESTSNHNITIPLGKALWRAQLGNDWITHEQEDGSTWDDPIPFSEQRMKPLRQSAHEGRVNPKGIPCLYAANNIKTAVAEVRPWHSALASVAQLTPARELKLVDCTAGNETNLDFCCDEPPPEEREKIVWREIGRAFSRPVNASPKTAEYVPTQILAELFRKNNYDGLAYKSLLGDGYNIALFDMDLLKIVDRRLYPVTEIRYEIGEAVKP